MKTEKIKSTLFKALYEAGGILTASLNERNIVHKKSALSLVTATDTKAEEAILAIIKEDFPDHAILAEESLGSGDSPYRWIIDPIDGTTNFAHTYPVCCVSIAYEENNVVKAGGIYDPFKKELFYAEKGAGAFLNDSPIHVSENPKLSDCILATGFPYDRRETFNEFLPTFKDFMMIVQGLRRSGSAALDLCYVACGRFDGFWEIKLQPWDCAAGALLVEEAGGKMSNYAGGTFDIHGFQAVASNKLVHDEMLKVLEPYKLAGLSKKN